MFAHVLVLLCGCVCALGGGIDDIGLPNIPPYIKAWDDYKELVKSLEVNIISIIENKPLLNDPRRQFGIIFYVINEEAKVQSGCLHDRYDVSYQINLAKSISEGISNPDKVIGAALELMNSVDEHTKNITDFIWKCLGPIDGCNARIDDLVKNENATYASQADVLLTMGSAAKLLNKQVALYKHAAATQTAVEFVIKGQEVLKAPVLNLAEVYRLISYIKRVVKC